jgi:hypothetical protein
MDSGELIGDMVGLMVLGSVVNAMSPRRPAYRYRYRRRTPARRRKKTSRRRIRNKWLF